MAEDEIVEEIIAVEDPLRFASPERAKEMTEVTLDSPPPAETFHRWRKRDPVEAIRIEHPPGFEVMTPHGWQQAKSGDYLVRDDTGDMWAVDQEQFQRTHERLDELGLPVSVAEAATPAPEEEPLPGRPAPEPEVERAVLALAEETSPRPSFAFAIYPVAMAIGAADPVRLVVRTLEDLEAVGKISVEWGSLGAPAKFWSQVLYTVVCEKCGHTTQVPPEGAMCPNCMRSHLEPKR